MKEYYDFIHDEDVLKEFFEIILPDLNPLEVFFISLSARNKYLTENERRELELGRTEMFEKKVIRYKEWNRFLRTIKKFNVEKGAYLTKNNSIIPDKAITIYININPSNILKAFKELNSVFMDYMFELSNNSLNGNDTENISKRIIKLDNNLLSCIQKNRGTKHYIDIDFDIDEKYLYHVLKFFTNELKERKIIFHVIKTKSGAHILMKRDTVKFNFNDLVEESYKKLYFLMFPEQSEEEMNMILTHGSIEAVTESEIIVNKNEMIPVPGTYQGGYPVTILKDF